MKNSNKVLSKFINRLNWLFFSDIFKVDIMPIRFGPLDPLKLIFEIMNSLMRRGLISYEEARRIIREALPPDNEMSPEEKDRLVDSMVRRIPPPSNPPSNP